MIMRSYGTIVSALWPYFFNLDRRPREGIPSGERRVRRGEWGRYGVADLRSGLRPNRGVMCKVRGSLPGPGRTTAERTTLAPRRSPRDSNQSVFLVMRSPPDASKRPQVTCLRASERIPGPRHETSIIERLIQVTSS